MNKPQNLPNYPKAPEGYHYEYRGKGWEAKNVSFIVINDESPIRWVSQFNAHDKGDAHGKSTLHYAELVKDKPNKGEIQIGATDFGCGVEYYIWQLVPSKKGADHHLYLHKDGTWNKTCGSGNFWPTQLAAKQFLEKHTTKNMDKFDKLKSEYEAAKQLIGKTVYFNSLEIKVNNVEIIFDQSSSCAVSQEVTRNGYCVSVKEGGLAAPFNKVTLKKPKPKVKVNGYEAEDCGDYFQFGCAKISKKQLSSARKWLNYQSGSWCDSNRKAESVKIGAGEFTLDILNQLLD